MANKNPQNLFQSGNQYGKLAKGVPKPTLTTTYKSFYKRSLGKFTQEEIDAMIESLPTQTKLHFLAEFANQQKQHEQFMLKLELEYHKLEKEQNSKNTHVGDVIEIGYVSLDDKDSEKPE